MRYPSALAASRAVEGAVVSGEYSPRPHTVVAGPQASPRGGPGGTAIARFAWVNVEGVALNARERIGDQIGIVLPPEFGQLVDWRAVFWDEVTCTNRIREGLALSMISTGNVVMRFAGGAYRGQPVYANVLDGSAISGYSALGELTPWSVLEDTAPGQLATISTWSKFL